MTEARTQELLERIAILEHRWATLVGKCPEGVDPLRHLHNLEATVNELRKVEKEHFGCIREQEYRVSEHPTGWGGTE